MEGSSQKRVENSVGKGEIAHYKQFPVFSHFFRKTCTADTFQWLGKNIMQSAAMVKCRKSWFKLLKESMERCTCCNVITDITLKMVINTIQSIQSLFGLGISLPRNKTENQSLTKAVLDILSNNPMFYNPFLRSLLKTLWEKEKMILHNPMSQNLEKEVLDIDIFSCCHKFSYPINYRI